MLQLSFATATKKRLNKRMKEKKLQSGQLLTASDRSEKVWVDGEQTWSGMSPSSSVVEVVVFGVSIDSRSFLRSDLKRVFSISRSCN